MQLLRGNEKNTTFAPELVSNDAQMAESVDALVSNTSGATHPGSTPGLGTQRGTRVSLFFCSLHADMSPWQCGVVRQEDTFLELQAALLSADKPAAVAPDAHFASAL